VFFIIVAIIIFRLDYQILIVILAGYLIELLRSRLRFRIGLHTTDTSILFLYLIYSLFLTIINFSYLGDLFATGVKRLLLDMSYMILLNNLIRNIDFNYFGKYIRRAICIVGIMGIIEFILKHPIWKQILDSSDYLPSINVGYRTFTFFYSPVLNGMFWGLAIIFLIKSLPLYNWKNIVLITISTANLLFSRSRSSMIGLAICLLLNFVYNLINKQTRRNRRQFTLRELLPSVFVVFILASCSYLFREPISSFINQSYERFQTMFVVGGSRVVRLETIDIGIDYIRQNFLTAFIGKGTNAGPVYLRSHPVIKGTWQWTVGFDNQYLTLLLESGYIGFLMVVGAAIIQLRKPIRTTDNVNVMFGLMLLFFWIVSFFFESLIFYQTFVLYIVIVFMQIEWNRQRINEKEVV
jgi:O-antigen ligase